MADDGQCERLIILQPDSSLTFKRFNSLSNSNATKTQNKYQPNDTARPAISQVVHCITLAANRSEPDGRLKMRRANTVTMRGEERRGRKPPSLLRVEDRGRVYWISWGTSADVEIRLLLF